MVNIREDRLRQQEAARGPMPVTGAFREAIGEASTGMDPAVQDPYHASVPGLGGEEATSYSTEEAQAERDRQQRFFQEEAERARVRHQVATLADRIGPHHEIERLEANWRATLGPTHRMQDRQEESRLGLNPQAQPFQPSQLSSFPPSSTQQQVAPLPHLGTNTQMTPPSGPYGGMPTAGSAQMTTGSPQTRVQGDNTHDCRGTSEIPQQGGLSGQYAGPDDAQEGREGTGQLPGNEKGP